MFKTEKRKRDVCLVFDGAFARMTLQEFQAACGPIVDALDDHQGDKKFSFDSNLDDLITQDLKGKGFHQSENGNISDSKCLIIKIVPFEDYENNKNNDDNVLVLPAVPQNATVSSDKNDRIKVRYEGIINFHLKRNEDTNAKKVKAVLIGAAVGFAVGVAIFAITVATGGFGLPVVLAGVGLGVGCTAPGGGFGLLRNYFQNKRGVKKNKENVEGLVDELQSLETVDTNPTEGGAAVAEFHVGNSVDEETTRLCAESLTLLSTALPKSTPDGPGVYKGVNNQSQPQPEQMPIVKKSGLMPSQNPSDDYDPWFSNKSSKSTPSSSAKVLNGLGSSTLDSQPEVRSPEPLSTERQEDEPDDKSVSNEDLQESIDIADLNGLFDKISKAKPTSNTQWECVFKKQEEKTSSKPQDDLEVGEITFRAR